MAKAIEFDSVEDIVRDSEIISYNDENRQFDYNLNEKSPMEKVLKSGSLNLIFNLGAWSQVVSPSLRYFHQSKSDKT